MGSRLPKRQLEAGTGAGRRVNPCECEHTHPGSLDARLFPSVVFAAAPAVTMDDASSPLPFRWGRHCRNDNWKRGRAQDRHAVSAEKDVGEQVYNFIIYVCMCVYIYIYMYM